MFGAHRAFFIYGGRGCSPVRRFSFPYLLTVMTIFLQEQSEIIRLFLIHERRKRGWNQSTIAEKIGIKQSYYSELENNPLQMRVETLIQILNAYETSFKQLF